MMELPQQVELLELKQKAELDKNTLTYSYSFGYKQELGMYVNISMQANGSAVK